MHNCRIRPCCLLACLLAVIAMSVSALYIYLPLWQTPIALWILAVCSFMGRAGREKSIAVETVSTKPVLGGEWLSASVILRSSVVVIACVTRTQLVNPGEGKWPPWGSVGWLAGWLAWRSVSGYPPCGCLSCDRPCAVTFRRRLLYRNKSVIYFDDKNRTFFTGGAGTAAWWVCVDLSM